MESSSISIEFSETLIVTLNGLGEMLPTLIGCGIGIADEVLYGLIELVAGLSESFSISVSASESYSESVSGGYSGSGKGDCRGALDSIDLDVISSTIIFVSQSLVVSVGEEVVRTVIDSFGEVVTSISSVIEIVSGVAGGSTAGGSECGDEAFGNAAASLSVLTDLVGFIISFLTESISTIVEDVVLVIIGQAIALLTFVFEVVVAFVQTVFVLAFQVTYIIVLTHICSSKYKFFIVPRFWKLPLT